MGNDPDGGVSGLRFDGSSIEPVFQPIFDLRDGSIVGYEALARGRGGAPRSPDALFDLARAEGRVAELDRACREAALASANAALASIRIETSLGGAQGEQKHA